MRSQKADQPISKKRSHQNFILICDRLKRYLKCDVLPFRTTDSDRPTNVHRDRHQSQNKSITAIALIHTKAIALNTLGAKIIQSKTIAAIAGLTLGLLIGYLGNIYVIGLRSPHNETLPVVEV